MSRVISVFSKIKKDFDQGWSGFRSFLNTLKLTFPYLLSPYSSKQEVTEQYPDPISSRTEGELPPRFRGMLSNDMNKCNGCGDCQSICPVSCIRVEKEEQRAGGRVFVKLFDINQAECVFCGLCVEVCPTNSLVHTRKYELAQTNKEKMILHYADGLRE